MVRGLDKYLLEAGEQVLNGLGRVPKGGPDVLHQGPPGRRQPSVLSPEVGDNIWG